MKTRKLALAALLALTPLTSLPAQRPGAARLTASLDSFVQANVLARGVTGVSIVIARGNEAPIARSWGFADADARRRVDASTAYRIGSMSKQFTAALVLKLVDQRKLTLNDPIGRYVTGLKPEWNGVTIEQILNHTAGLPRDWRVPARVGEDMPRDSLIAMAARSTAPTPPAGTRFGYSNTGYMLLAAVVEKLHGKPYGAVLRDEIARPLGLATLGWCGDMEAAGRVAKPYHRTPADTLGTVPYIHPSQMLAGGICSHAGDIAKWNRALHGGRVLSAASYAAMTTPRGTAARASVPYGLGLYVRPTAGGGMVIVHDGSTPGYAGENVWYPAEKLSVTMLTNTTGRLGADLNLTEEIGRIALGRAPVPAAPAAQPAPPAAPSAMPAISITGAEAQRKFVGDYELAPGQVFKITFEDGSFYVTPPGDRRGVLVHESGATYRLGRGGSTTTTTFLADASGQVVGMLTRQEGAERTLRKIR